MFISFYEWHHEGYKIQVFSRLLCTGKGSFITIPLLEWLEGGGGGKGSDFIDQCT